jgi:hypothetical protein
MSHKIRTILTTLLAVIAIPAPAQKADAQEIVVTAARRDADDYSDTMPVVTLRRTADFAVQAVRVAGDTREQAKRQEEIYAMIRGAIELAPKMGVELASGEYVIEPLTLANYKSLILKNDGRPDSDRTVFLVKTRLGADVDAKAALERIGRFIRAVPAVGRAEIKAADDMTLSVVNPDQYRSQIADLIAADARAMASRFGPDYRVEVKGLDRPVEWARASLTEVNLYLPASYVVVPR